MIHLAYIIVATFSIALIALLVFLLPFAAGGFIYIAATDLVPEIKKEVNIEKSMLTMLIFICGILIMWLTKIAFHG